MTLEQIAREWAEEHNATRQKTYLAGMKKMLELVIEHCEKNSESVGCYIANYFRVVLNGGEIGE